MTNEERDIQRKLRVLQHAEKIGNARKACRYFGAADQKTQTAARRDIPETCKVSVSQTRQETPNRNDNMNGE